VLVRALALVPVIAVLMVVVTIMLIINVVAVLFGFVTASWAVFMFVRLMNAVMMLGVSRCCISVRA
jgi:hypothetical protein